MTSMFDGYLNEMDELVRTLDAKKSEARRSGSTDPVDAVLRDMEEMLGQMRIEVHSVRIDARKSECMERMKAFQTRIADEKRVLLVWHRSPGGDADVGSARPTQMTREQQNNEALARLEAARRQLGEAEDVATSTLANLGEQRETLVRVHRNLRDTNEVLGKSTKLVSKMCRWWRG